MSTGVCGGVSRIWQGGGPRKIFFRFGNLHVAKLGGPGGMPPPPRNLFEMVQFGAFWCIYGSDFVFKKFNKLPFYI